MKKEVENIVPYNRVERKTDQVRAMFNNIAPHYDRFNHTASMGIDRYWRRKGILSLKAFEPKDILDVATGTGDYAISAFNLLHPDKITGIDLSTGMMEVGEKKVSSLGLSKKISFKQEDCTSLSFDNDSFDAVIAAFGVRNFENIEAGYREMFRVMKPGAYMLAFGGTRTFHRLVCAIQDAVFEIRDTIMWLYGTGFPNSHNLDGDWEGWGTALKPAFEPVVVAHVRATVAGRENHGVLAEDGMLLQ